MFNDRNKKSKIRQQQIQKQEQLSAYSRKTTHDIFLMTMEWLEKYIEVAGYYPDWENRKQIKNNNIKRKDIYGNPNKAENSLSTQLVLLKDAVDDDPPFLRDEVKEEFYRWISATGISAGNILPKAEKLKHFLYGINEILEGRGEKIQRDIENRKRILDPNSPEYMEQMSKLFAHIQGPMHDERETRNSLVDKTHLDIEIANKFGGNIEQGKQTFGQIAGMVADSHKEDFHFFPQRDQQTASSSGVLGIYPTNLNEVVQDVKNNPQNWRLDEIPTETNHFGAVKKQEWLLIHRNARLDEGKLNFNNNPIYRWENFNSQQRFEIKQVKNISGDYLTNEEIKWVVREVKENPRIWTVREIDKQIYLVHTSAQIKRNEIGTLIHNQQKFDKVELAEINGAFERATLIDEIKQNAKLEKGLFVINLQTNECFESEDWFIHNSLERRVDDKTGYIIYVPNLMLRAKDLTETEQKEVGYKSETTHQLQTQNRPSGGKGGWGSTAVWGSFTVISLIGLAFTK